MVVLSGCGKFDRLNVIRKVSSRDASMGSCTTLFLFPQGLEAVSGMFPPSQSTFAHDKLVPRVLTFYSGNEAGLM